MKRARMYILLGGAVSVLAVSLNIIVRSALNMLPRRLRHIYYY